MRMMAAGSSVEFMAVQEREEEDDESILQHIDGDEEDDESVMQRADEDDMTSQAESEMVRAADDDMTSQSESVMQRVEDSDSVMSGVKSQRRDLSGNASNTLVPKELRSLGIDQQSHASLAT